MNCERAREHFADYWAGGIDPACEEHLDSCAACHAEWNSLNDVWRKLGLIPEESPSPALRARFYQSLEAYQRGMARPKERRWNWAALQAVAASVMLLAGVAIGHLITERGTRTETPEVAALQAEVRTMRQMVTLALLQQQSASDRLKGVNLTSQLEQSDTQVLSALLSAVSHDPNVNVRLAAVDALRRFVSAPAVRSGLEQALGIQDSPLVQIALIDLMLDVRDAQSVRTLRRLAQASEINPEVKERAQWALAQFK